MSEENAKCGRQMDEAVGYGKGLTCWVSEWHFKVRVACKRWKNLMGVGCCLAAAKWVRWNLTFTCLNCYKWHYLGLIVRWHGLVRGWKLVEEAWLD